ncbi:MAG: N-acetyltransferase [Sulfurovum sp.]|jgi:amino-acid N-acetyltransferase|nr:MAG: N-acetyltransferase [Sulfurovum sp.]
MIELKKATLRDIKEMQSMVVSEVRDGIILKRSDDEIATNIRSYVLAKEGNRLVGYGSLHIHSASLAEIRSLIVDKAYRSQGVGKKIVNFALDEAKDYEVEEVLVLTYSAEFFKKLGFLEIPKTDIPDHKIWADCIKCIHFPVCNEISLIYKIV